MKNSPCFTCENRHLKCHCDCAAYIDYQAEREREKKARKTDMETNIYIHEKIVKMYVKRIKSQRK